jgi:hypothetical protein
MTEREQLAQALVKRAEIAQGLSKATYILGMQRDKFVELMTKAAEAVKTQAVSTVPFQSECPECKRKITVAFVNGQSRVKWSE